MIGLSEQQTVARTVHRLEALPRFALRFLLSFALVLGQQIQIVLILPVVTRHFPKVEIEKVRSDHFLIVPLSVL